jgi:hypothetical protein
MSVSARPLNTIKKILSARSGAVIAVAAAAILASGGLGGGIASAATGGSASQPHPAPYPGAGTAASAPLLGPVTGGTFSPAACTPFVDGDFAHVSSGDVSAHGWWYQGDCANTKTTVTVGLQEYFSDGTWHDQGTPGQKSVYPGGGSANRAATRQVCDGVALAAWRSYVIVGIGNGASAYTTAKNLNCTHW